MLDEIQRAMHGIAMRYRPTWWEHAINQGQKYVKLGKPRRRRYRGGCFTVTKGLGPIKGAMHAQRDWWREDWLVANSLAIILGPDWLR